MKLDSYDFFQDEKMLHILREITKSPEITQRELSSRLGISLGKANSLIHALIRQGLVRMERTKASVNRPARLYYLTSRGFEEKVRTTCLFLKRKKEEHERIAEEIRTLQQEMRESGVPEHEQDLSANIL